MFVQTIQSFIWVQTLIRMGERSVLYFDFDDKNVQFRRWDDIKNIATAPRFGTACS